NHVYGFNYGGGAVDVASNTTPVNAVFFGCLFVGNGADHTAGGAILARIGGGPQVLDSQFIDNVSGGVGGLQTFVNVLANGGTPEQVAATLAGSQEYFDLHGDSAEGFVQALYEDVLGRQADAGGLAAWEQALAGGQSRKQVASAFLSSPEYLTGLVAAAYRSALGRDADAGGLAFYVGELLGGTTDQFVLAQLLGSAEAFAKRA
ncbi:MAG TPA: DUF4214 domain-containing protein, partial [Gemmataceae bacterium]|nr:DUF4214 domain-containing protein [Gemmataceae bacterium]